MLEVDARVEDRDDDPSAVGVGMLLEEGEHPEVLLRQEALQEARVVGGSGCRRAGRGGGEGTGRGNSGACEEIQPVEVKISRARRRISQGSPLSIRADIGPGANSGEDSTFALRTFSLT